MYVYSYALAKLVFCIVASIVIALFTFYFNLLFIRCKVNYMTTLKNEVTIMSQGDLDHTIKILGNDEICRII